MKRIIFFLLAALLIAPGAAFAADYGAVLSGNYLLEDLGEPLEKTNRFIGIVSPWFSAPLGEMDFYFSAGAQADYADYRVGDKLLYVPELYRLEVSGTFDTLSFKAGRVFWQDPSRLIARGRFDGIDLSLDAGDIQLGAAVLYTGFLYYDTANINVSPTDPKNYSADFDWSDFAETYFAPRRILAALYGDFPGFPSERGRLHAGLMAQFDLSDAEEMHIQYLFLRHTLAYKQFDMSLAGAAQMENTPRDGTRAGYAASVEFGWRFDGEIKDRLALGMKWASGKGRDTAAFFPIVREDLGMAIKPWLSGMTMIYASYEARFAPTLSAELRGRYFLRTDTSTYFDPYIDTASYLLGAEAGAALVWAPFSDLSFSLAGAAFFPKTGKAMRDDAPLRWAVSLGTIFSL